MERVGEGEKAVFYGARPDLSFELSQDDDERKWSQKNRLGVV